MEITKTEIKTTQGKGDIERGCAVIFYYDTPSAGYRWAGLPRKVWVCLFEAYFFCYFGDSVAQGFALFDDVHEMDA